MSRIDEIEARLAAATPGPWREGRSDMQAYHGVTREPYTNIYVDGTRVDGVSGRVIPRVVARAVDDLGEPDAANNKADATFIANAPADLRYLLDEVKRLREALKRSYWREYLPSDKPVQYVGVYTLKWGRVDEPTVAFGQWEDEQVDALLSGEGESEGRT